MSENNRNICLKTKYTSGQIALFDEEITSYKSYVSGLAKSNYAS